MKKHSKYADNTYDNIAYLSPCQDILICYYTDVIRTGKLEIYDLFTGENLLCRDSRSIYPSDNYALEDVSSLYYDFENDYLYTGGNHDETYICRNKSRTSSYMENEIEEYLLFVLNLSLLMIRKVKGKLRVIVLIHSVEV